MRSLMLLLVVIVSASGVYAGVPPTYTTVGVWPSGINPRSPVIANFDGDDYPDMISLAGGCTADGTYCENQHIRLYWGTGGLAPAFSHTVELPVTHLYAGDFDGDGLTDVLATGAAGGPVYLIRNLGGRAFQIPTIVSTSATAALFTTRTFDFNADFRPDLLSWDGSAYYPGLGVGDATFSFVNSGIAAGLQTAVGDLNGDGRDDLVVVTRTTVRGYLSNGNGTFTGSYSRAYCQIHCDLGATPHSVQIGDLDGDGRKDVALAMSSADQSGAQSNLIFWYSPAWNGPLNWTAGDWYSNRPVEMFVGDLDGDGKAEVGFPNRFDKGTRTLFLGSNAHGGAPVKLGNQSIFTADPCEVRYAGGMSPIYGSCASRDITVGGLRGQGQRGADIVEAWSLHYSDYYCSDGDPMDGIPPECYDTFTDYDYLTIYRNPNARYLRMSVVPSKNPSTPLEAVTLTATVTGSAAAPAGAVVFASDNVTLCNNVPLVSGTATCNTTLSGVGSHFVQAVFASSNSTYGNASASYSHTTIKATPTVSVNTSKTPSAVGEAVTFTATVTSGATGSFSFYRNGNYLGGAVVSGATATLTTSALPAGTHSISAVYSGDSVYSSATAYVTQAVVAKASLTLTLKSSLTPAPYGTSVTFTAGGLSTATGSVSFKVDGIVVGTSAISAGEAVYSTNALSVGTRAVVAEYAGNASFNAAISPVVNQVITKATPTIVYSCSPTTVTYGQSISCNVEVRPSGGGAVPQGTVDLSSDGSVAGWGTFTLDAAGKAAASSWSTAAPGVHTTQARYNGDASYESVTSGGVNLTVNKAPVTITVVSTKNPSVFGDTITFTFTFAGVPGQIPTGTAAVTDGTNALATVTLDAAGKATYTTSALAAGSHVITATYNGNSFYN